MKKIVILFTALIIFIFPINHSMFPNEASAIWGKVANESAKKVAKEVIKEIAQETAINMAVNEAQKIADAASWNLNVKDEYTAICMEALQPSGECKKPAQIKTTLTETDKSNISATAGTELEKALNNGVKYTKWQKFLDFFLPIFSVSLVLTGISYAIDPEVKSLFDDVAINTLIALGLMQPIYANVTPSPTVTDATTGEPLPEKPLQPPGSTPSLLYKNEFIDKQYANIILTPTLFTTSSAVIFQDIAYNNTTLNSLTLTVRREVNSGNIVFWNFPTSGNPSFGFHGQMNNITVKQGNTVLASATTGSSISVERALFTDLDKLKSIMTRLPYFSNGYWYTTLLFNTVSGLTYTVQGSSVNAPPGTQVKQLDANVWAKTNTGQIAQQLTVYENATFKEWAPYQPNFEDMTIPTSPTKYEDDDEVMLIPPIAIPYTHTDTGEQLELKHDPTTGTTEVVDKDGNIVPEDKVKVGDPVVTTDPEGKPQVQPPATPSNPAPEPIPLTPPTTPPPPAPPIETLPPVFPEGESCDVGLKLPKLSPLAFAVSDAFPFSIPFDLYDGFQAIFSEMGNEKPEFNYKFDFMGEEKQWAITIPDYFDNWKKFTDSFLIFIFDVGIVFMIFRFMGGSK